jgi:predicted DNA-binding transcriptional regulator AlpA
LPLYKANSEGVTEKELEMQPKIYLTLKDVIRRYGVSQATVYRWLANDNFPKGIKIGATRRWNIDDLLEFEQQRRGLE